ncbi:MAG TPA: hypothetical protein VEW03_07465, partial [Longimicrobiaceae bacterium]|nr:hypothetical protein [Longimicrobiaceae bacterium]
LGELFRLLRGAVAEHSPAAAHAEPEFLPFRAGDLRHSQASLSRIRMHFRYAPEVSVAEGIATTVRWYAHAARHTYAGYPAAPVAEAAAAGAGLASSW